MANVKAGLYYAESHEWVRVEDGVAVIGISDYAQGALGDIVYLELPAVGDTFEKGEALGVVESVKTLSDLYAPVSGEVVEVNDGLMDTPEAVNEDAYDAWFVKIKGASIDGELETLLDADKYGEHIEGLDH